MDTRQLRAFLAVMETGGISAAADQLGYAQSSVSDQLRTLERDLGTRVLNRTSIGTVPTEAGQRLLPYARRMLGLDTEMRLAPLTIQARWRDGIGPAEAPLTALVELTKKFSPATWAMARS